MQQTNDLARLSQQFGAVKLGEIKLDRLEGATFGLAHYGRHHSQLRANLGSKVRIVGPILNNRATNPFNQISANIVMQTAHFPAIVTLRVIRLLRAALNAKTKRNRQVEQHIKC